MGDDVEHAAPRIHAVPLSHLSRSRSRPSAMGRIGGCQDIQPLGRRTRAVNYPVVSSTVGCHAGRLGLTGAATAGWVVPVRIARLARGAASGHRRRARLRARHWLRLAGRSRVGARSEDEVRRALAPLEAEGWRLRHSLPCRGPWGYRLRRDRADRGRVRDRFLPLFWSSRVPFVVRFAQAGHAFSARVSVRLPCCTCVVAFSRQQVVLPGGQAYWTVLDGDFESAWLAALTGWHSVVST